ncbi:hypothetical protein R75461_08302 [Paraburkholderia nemoris]|uniref:hypothetical protein n=1 Tax=Paraburkholderia nemoris TaxID=2793076 RepID=UPI00190D4E44|nr:MULTISPECIES: hypothetical protein [Paraburkholderia]MBK3786976.1 hypothetical protein [Paraburkholderia aspalathi]CAE6866421.1 hypothetical protein R75461_08302 [Paraburkholderia nemoris]
MQQTWSSTIKRHIETELSDPKKALSMLGKFSATGLFFLSGYYAGLRFTPDVSLGQSAFVAFQAALWGTLIFGLLGFSISGPAITYHLLDINTDDVARKARSAAVRSLHARALWSQVFWFCVFATCAIYPFRHDPEYGMQLDLGFGVAVICMIFSAVFTLTSPLIRGSEATEGRGIFLASVVLIGFFSLIAIAMLYTLYATTPHYNDNDWWGLLGAAGLVIVTGAMQASFRKRDVVLKVAIGAVACVQVMFIMHSVSAPFRLIANVIGIAEQRPVSIAIPVASCRQAEAILHPLTSFSCRPDGTGLLTNVELLNSLGNRWLVKFPGNERTVILPGKDAIVLR